VRLPLPHPAILVRRLPVFTLRTGCEAKERVSPYASNSLCLDSSGRGTQAERHAGPQWQIEASRPRLSSTTGCGALSTAAAWLEARVEASTCESAARSIDF